MFESVDISFLLVFTELVQKLIILNQLPLIERFPSTSIVLILYMNYSIFFYNNFFEIGGIIPMLETRT